MTRTMKKGPLNKAQERGLQRLSSSSSKYIIGIDEVGLGSWAGPLVVAGVVTEVGWAPSNVKDSKALTHDKRMKAWTETIQPGCACWVVLSMSSARIDQVGVGKALFDLTEGVGLYLRHRFPDAPVVQDGDKPVSVNGHQGVICFPKADSLVVAVAAASIVAKVSRDLFMKRAALDYPHYGFDTNVGYHSEKHRRGLDQHGICPLHRRSYRPVAAYC